MAKDSYIDKTKEILEKNGKITSWDAIQKMGNTRLSATIYNLRHLYGMNIGMRMKTAVNGKRFGEYYLIEE